MAGPSWAGPRLYRICDTILSQKGLQYLEPTHHLYLPAIQRYAAKAGDGTRMTVRATVDSPSHRDIRENINIDKISPTSVRFPTVTQGSNIRLVLTEYKPDGTTRETAEEYMLRELVIEGKLTAILSTHWLDQSWWTQASYQRMTLLFIAMSMARSAGDVVFHLPLDTRHDLANRVKRQLELVQKGEAELEDALIDLDSRFLNELITSLPALPDRAEILNYADFGGRGEGVAISFNKNKLYR